MSIFNDKSLKGVADAVSKIMEASKKEEEKFHNKLDKLVHKTFGHSPDEMKKEEKELSPKQKAIAKMSEPEHKIDAGDLAKLRAGHKPVKEEAESCEDEAEEAVEKHEKKMHGKKGEVAKHEKEMHKESFTSLIESYKKDGLKSLSKMKKEEVDNETYEKEMKDQKDKFDGKKKGADVAKASVQAVKVEEEVENIDEADQYTIQNTKTKQTYHVSKYPISKNNEKYKKIKSAGGDHAHAVIHKNGKPVTEESENIDDINGVAIETVEERTLTEPEMKKREEYVKGMKKKLPGFKERYGERAKEVIYATAAKMAKED
jgi:hypothetical protein